MLDLALQHRTQQAQLESKILLTDREENCSMKSVSIAPQLEKHGSVQGVNQSWSELCERIAASFASPSY